MSRNRCNRCNRKLRDPHAQYGWRCAQILGTTNALNYAGDEAYAVYQAGMISALAFLEAHPKTRLSDEETLAFYEAMGKAALAYGMGIDVLYYQAIHEACSILGCEDGQEHNELLQSLSLEDHLWLKDQQDFLNDRYATDGMLDEAPNEEIAALQERLNEAGYADRFGNPLKEDGIYGPRTEWAADVMKGVVPLAYTNVLHSSHTNIGVFLSPVGNKKIKNMLGTIDMKSISGTIKMDQRLFHLHEHGVNSIHGNHPSKHINMDLMKDAPAFQVEIAKTLNHRKIPEPVFTAFSDFDKVAKIAKKGGKALAVAGIVLDAVELGTAIHSDLNDEDGKLGKTTVSSAAGIAGGWGGGFLGAKGGALGGAAIGTAICPGLGTVIGGFLGGLIGGIVGAFAGRQGATTIVDAVW